MSAITHGGGGGGGRGIIIGVVLFFGLIASIIGLFLSGAMPKVNDEQGGAVAQAPTTGRGGMTEQDVILNTRDFTEEEWNTLINQGSERVAQFNVDVYIRTSHAAEHGAQEMNDALRCATQQGTVAILSENYTRRLHLLCHDPETGSDYVIIIQKIKRSIDEFRNSTSELVTAFKLNPETMQANIAAYIHGEVNISQNAILVRLAFKAGELFFSPYK